jgi:lysophospholipase L1-like esterase
VARGLRRPAYLVALGARQGRERRFARDFCQILPHTFATMALASCGGGGGDQQAATPCSPVSIILNGDSTQWGYLAGGGGARADVYPELALQLAMDRRFGAGAVVVRTGAVSGTTAVEGLAQPHDGDIVVYNPGVNDVAYGVAPEAYRAALRALAAAAAPARVVFETPLPVSTAAVSYDGIMREVAGELGAPLIEARAFALSVPDWYQRYALDGVHLTGEGYAAVVDAAVVPVLVPIVAGLRCR